MINGCYDSYQLTAEQFNNLFTENVDVNTLNLLAESAADGNLDCIDMLLNLALRHDDVGGIAENILFDLFSGKTKGYIEIDKDIQQASLKLYETACNAKGKNNESMSKFYSQSKLLYMAGSAMTNITQKQDASTMFRGRDRPQSQHETFDSSDIWSNGRMLMTDEVNSAMTGILSNTDNLSFHFPIGLIEPVNKTNNLSEQMADKIQCANAFEKAEVFPINTGDHWVLFVLYKNRLNGKAECVVFNSFSGLSKDIRKHFINSADMVGVAEENVRFIHGDMQENVPNGCGIFTIKAAELLSKNSEREPVDTLNEFVESFSKLSAEEQMLFNIQSRRQMYEYSIVDALSRM